ncbi:MAG: outer membrane transport energization protein ExbD [Rhodobacteraceae bacterium HLUCCA08]|nr:MAG: outer membrane transport energization protein ExbD [Rhodobacteraceae bacterium HLUCCA08]
MFRFAQPRPRRRPSLTPMIDVVFLLLVFFMLVAQYGREDSMALAAGGAPGAWQGPPRLVTVTPGALALNGQVIAPEALAAALAPLMDGPEDPVVLRGTDGATLQDLVRVTEALRDAGLMRLIVVE